MSNHIAEYQPSQLEKGQSEGNAVTRALTPDYKGGEVVRGLGSQMGTLNAFSEEGHMFLIPTPSDDPNDPLNWPRWYKWLITVTACSLTFCGCFVAAGPAVSLLGMVQR